MVSFLCFQVSLYWNNAIKNGKDLLKRKYLEIMNGKKKEINK